MAKILVVDDSPTEVFQFKGMLEKIGHEVITAENGRDGVAVASSEQPDIVLMDRNAGYEWLPGYAPTEPC
jgi:twitching motility two-component system response regulator PilH